MIARIRTAYIESPSTPVKHNNNNDNNRGRNFNPPRPPNTPAQTSSSAPAGGTNLTQPQDAKYRGQSRLGLPTTAPPHLAYVPNHPQAAAGGARVNTISQSSLSFIARPPM